MRGQPMMPLSGEAHVAAEVLTGLLDGEIIESPQGEPHLLTAFVGHEWTPMKVDEEEREKLREHGVVSVSVRQWQDKPILGILNLETGETRYEQGEGVFSRLSPWLGQLAARVARLRVPLYKLDPAKWEMRVLAHFGQDKQLPNAAFPGLSLAQQHRVYAMGRSLDRCGRAAIQGEPGTGKTRLATATAARMAYQWRHRNTPLFLGKEKQPAWMRGLRQAWLKNPRALALLGLEALREEGTGRIVAYRRADGTLLAPEDAGPQALPVLVTTPKKVTKEYAAEIRAAWKEAGAEVMLIEHHTDIPRWLKCCATSSAPAVIAIFPHSLTRAFGRAWQPAVIERQIVTEVKVTEPDESLLERLKPVKNEHGVLLGYKWKDSGEWYTRPERATRFFCPSCFGMVKAVPGKLHEVEKQPQDEGMLLFKKKPEMADNEDGDDKLEPVTSRTWLTLKPRWCHCRADAHSRTLHERAQERVRTPLWTDARRPEVQQRHPQLSFACWSEAIERVQRRAQIRAGSLSPLDYAAMLPLVQQVKIALADQEAAQALLNLVAPLDPAIRESPGSPSLAETIVQALRRHPRQGIALALARLVMPLVDVAPRLFRDLWETAYPTEKMRSGKEREQQARSLKAMKAPEAYASHQAPPTGSRAAMLAQRRRKLADARRQRAGQQYAMATPLADSFSPYDYLHRFFKGCVALAIVDESHNGRGRDTDIGHAFHQAMLASQCHMLATGTHFGGDLLSFFHYWFRFHPQFWQRLGLGWNDAEKALARYGVIQEWTKQYESEARRGSGQTNVQVSTIPAPGLSAKLIPYLLEDLAYLAVLDVGAHMPPRIEIPEIVSMSDQGIEDVLKEVVATERLAKAELAAFQQATRRGELAMLEDEQAVEAARLQQAVEQALQQEQAVKEWAHSRHLAAHYWRLVHELEDLAQMRNQAARLAKGTIPRWFAALPCDAPFEVWQTKRDGWGDQTARELLVSTCRLAWDHLYPLEKRLLTIVERERALGRRVMVYHEQNELRSMARRLEWVLREYHPWTLPNSTPAEDRQEAILDAVLKRGHDVVIVPYRRVNEGLNLQSAIDTVLWYEMALNLFMLDQASRRAWRLGKCEEVKIYYLVYANTAGHRKLRKLGQQSGAAAAFAGEVARGALVEEAGADQTTLARLSSLLEKDDEGEFAPPVVVSEGELAQEETDLKAAFARRAEELQAALRAGRAFLGGIEDTLEQRLRALLGDPAFTAPVWKEQPVPHPIRLPLPRQDKPLLKPDPREGNVDTLPAMPAPPIATTDAKDEPIAPALQGHPQAASMSIPTPLKTASSRAEVEFGNLAHIQAFARRRSRRVRSYDRVKRPAPLVERDIPALDDTQPAPYNGQSAPAPLTLSLWDMLATQAPEADHLPVHPTALPHPSPAPQQSRMWE